MTRRFLNQEKKSLRIQDLALAKADVCYSKVFGNWNISIFYGWISLQKCKKKLQADGKGSLHHGQGETSTQKSCQFKEMRRWQIWQWVWILNLFLTISSCMDISLTSGTVISTVMDFSVVLLVYITLQVVWLLFWLVVQLIVWVLLWYLVQHGFHYRRLCGCCNRFGQAEVYNRDMSCWCTSRWCRQYSKAHRWPCGH